MLDIQTLSSVPNLVSFLSRPQMVSCPELLLLVSCSVIFNLIIRLNASPLAMAFALIAGLTIPANIYFSLQAIGVFGLTFLCFEVVMNGIAIKRIFTLPEIRLFGYSAQAVPVIAGGEYLRLLIDLHQRSG